MQREREKNQSRGEERILDPCYPYYPFQVEITVEREGGREVGRGGETEGRRVAEWDTLWGTPDQTRWYPEALIGPGWL